MVKIMPKVERIEPGRPPEVAPRVEAKPEWAEDPLDIFNRARRFSIRPIVDALGTNVDNPLGVTIVRRPVVILGKGTTIREVRAPGLAPKYIEKGGEGIVQLPTGAHIIDAIHEYWHALGAGEVQAYLSPFLFAHSKGFNVKNDFKRELINYENDLLTTLNSFISNFKKTKDVRGALNSTFKETVGREPQEEADIHSLHGKILAAFALAGGNPIEAYKSAGELDATKAYDLTKKLVADETLIGQIQDALATRKVFFNKWRLFGRFRGLDQKINWRKTKDLQPKISEIQNKLKYYRMFK